MEPRITFRQLTYFIEAARGGSLVRAADSLGVSQPAVTKTIRDLERTLATQLFLRSRSGVDLTAQGRAFLDRATAAMAEIRDGLSLLDALRDAEQGNVRVGVSPIAASRLLPLAVARLKKTRPQVSVNISSGDNEKMLPALKLGQLDIVVGRRGSPESMTGLIDEVLFDDHLAIVVDRDHRFSDRDGVTLSDLVGEPWAIPIPGTVARHRLKQMFRDQEVTFPTNIVEGVAGTFFRDYLRDAQAVGAIPNNLVAEDVAEKRLVRLMHDTEAAIGTTGITLRENLELDPSTRVLIRELKSAVKQLNMRQ